MLIKMSSQNVILLFVLTIAIAAILIFTLSNGNSNSQNLTIPSSTLSVPAQNTSVAGCSTCSVVTPNTTLISSTGRKRALLFGCNYNFPNSLCISNGCVLNGCIDDVNNIRGFLMNNGFSNNNIQMYTDFNTYGTEEFPTKALMLSTIRNIVSATAAGDTSFIWYSGHGAQIQANGGYSECWCPPDTLQSGNFLTDIELHDAIKDLAAGAKLFIGSDSCHSGTVFDLTYYFAEQNKTNYRTVVNSSTKSIKTLANQSRTTTRNADNLKTGFSPLVLVKDTNNGTINGSVITLSGCQDADVSADAYENGSAQGAMTWSFITTANYVLSNNGSLQDLLLNMRNLLKSNNYTQIPQIESSLDIDPQSNLQIVLF